MGRILFWVGLAVIIYTVIVIGRKRRSAEEKALRREARREAQAAAAAAQTPQPMLQCPVCGTHFPKEEAVLGNGVAYCSEKCRGEAPRPARVKTRHGRKKVLPWRRRGEPKRCA